MGSESNPRTNAERKAQKYRDLIQQQPNKYKNVKLIHLSMSALGIFDKRTSDFLDMLTALQFDKTTKNYIIRKMTTIVIRTLTTSSADVTKSGLVLSSYLIDLY